MGCPLPGFGKMAADFALIPTVVSQLKHQPNNLLANRLLTNIKQILYSKAAVLDHHFKSFQH